MSWFFNYAERRFTVAIIFVLFAGRLSAQEVSASRLVKFTASAAAFRQSRSAEKLYLQFDKPYYTQGDTIWFKAYLFDAPYFGSSAKSGIMYIELTTDSNILVKRMMLPVARGTSWGNITIDPNVIPEGSYTLRAYTNWMRNFGDNYVFKKRFYFGNTSGSSWLINTRVNVSKGNGTDTARLQMQLNSLNNEPLILRDIGLKIFDGKRLWYKSKTRTMVDGSLNINFALKKPAKQLSLLISDGTAGDSPPKLKIPVTLNRLEDIDLQFMPEGGNLVAGLPATVGFKAIGPDGMSVTVEGNIYDSRDQIVASFKSVHNGIGSFEMTPKTGETYTAKVTLSNAAVKNFPLPCVKNEGTVLKIRPVKNADSLAITITGSNATRSYYLLGQARGIVCYAAVINLAGHAFKCKIPNLAFPTGIAHFTLLTAAMQPLNERQVFIDHRDQLQIKINAHKLTYGRRDSVALHIQVTDKDKKPLNGNFSLAVTDDSQVKTGVYQANLISSLLLTSDLKGNVEDPGFYFPPNADESVSQQLDNLLLTQGWVGYDWKDLFNFTKTLLFAPENEFNIGGKVVNVFNKPIAGTQVVLLSKKPVFILDTVTDTDGRFIFKNIVPVDTPVYIIQARNKRGKSFNVDVRVDEFIPPVFTKAAENMVPWYVNSDSAFMKYVRNNSIRKKEQEKNVFGRAHQIKEVTIKSKKIIKGSQNLNGPGNADLVIDEQELEKAGKKTFLQLLQERLKTFKEGMYNKNGDAPEPEAQIPPTFITDGQGLPGLWYFVNGKPIKLIIDGISITKIVTGSPIFTLSDLTYYLSSHSAEDIKGIEVMSTSRYAARYVPAEYAMIIHPSDYTFIEITTRSGHGPAIGNTPGVYLYKPLPFSVPRQFYVPKYTVKNNQPGLKDNRATIFWQPNVATDSKGNATVWFYTADIAGTYTVILEGTDWNGNIGSVQSKIMVR